MDTFLELTHFLQRWGDLNVTSAFVVAALIIVFSLVPIPRSTVNIAIGAVFGFAVIPVIMVSNAIGAAIAFLLARYFFFDRLQSFAMDKPRLRALLKAIDKEGWRLVALLRLGGPLPGVVQNYLYGLTSIPLWVCTALTLGLTIPQTFVHVYLGTMGRAMIENQAASMDLMVNMATLIVVLCAVALIARRMSAALREGDAGPAAPRPSTCGERRKHRQTST